MIEARKLVEEQIVICRQIGNNSLLANGLFGFGEILLAEGNLQGARKKHEEALGIRNQLGEKRTAVESRLALAALSIEEGRPAEAEGPAQEAVGVFRVAKASDNEARAYLLLSRSLLAQGELELAKSEIASARKLAARSGNVGLRAQVAIAEARILFALRNTAEAARALNTTIADTKRVGLVRLEYEARLALGEIEIKSGNITLGQMGLRTLEKDATARGLNFITRKAAAAAK